MESLDCSVCFLPFNDNLVPKTLECGHSLCSSCITRLLKGKSECPTCSRKMTMQNVTQYSTAYDLLNLINSVNKLQIRKDCLKLSIDTLKQKFEHKLNSLAEEEKVLTKKTTSLQGGLFMLEEHNEFKVGDVKKLEEMVVRLEKEFLKICPSPNSEDSTIEHIRIQDFESHPEFLYEIYRRARKGEKVFAIHKIRNEIKYGHILSQHHELLVHSLSTTPKEEHGQINVVKLVDLERCASNGRAGWKVKQFVTFCCNGKGLERTVRIEMVSHHHLTPQFRKLCTGELDGCSYKGSAYGRRGNVGTSRGILEVSNYTRKGVAEEGQLLYMGSYRSPDERCKVGDVVVLGWEGGSFGLDKITREATYSGIMGKVVPPCSPDEDVSFKDSHFNKIIDCGLSFALE